MRFSTLSLSVHTLTVPAYRFLKRCQKPNKREFIGIAQAVGVGFLVMGFVGFFVKLVHIPINNVLGEDAIFTLLSISYARSVMEQATDRLAYTVGSS